jgi:hypothetical protein
MMKFKEIQQLMPVRAIEDVVCNRCGKSCVDKGCGREFAYLQVSWGCDSRKDMEEHVSHLCEPCYDEIVATFAIPPTIEDLLP